MVNRFPVMSMQLSSVANSYDHPVTSAMVHFICYVCITVIQERVCSSIYEIWSRGKLYSHVGVDKDVDFCVKGFPKVPDWFRKLFPYSDWGAELNASITPLFFSWLVGPCEVLYPSLASKQFLLCWGTPWQQSWERSWKNVCRWHSPCDCLMHTSGHLRSTSEKFSLLGRISQAPQLAHL